MDQDEELQEVEERISALYAARRGAYALARVLSLAARVERSLLRRARLLLPNVDASAEADLWASPLVASQTPQGFVFDPRAAEILRSHLAADPVLLEQAWRLIAWDHRDAPWPIRAEEMINRLSVAASAEDADRAEQVLLATARRMIESADPVAAGQWVMRALSRLPAAVGGSPAARAIHAGVGAHLDGHLDIDQGDLPPDAMEAWLPWLLSRSTNRVDVGVAFGDGFVDVGPADTTTRRAISVPDTTPLVLDVSWHDGLTAHSRRVKFERGKRGRIAVSATEVEIRAIDGTRYRVRRAGTHARGAGFDFSGIRARHRPFVGRDGEVTEFESIRERQVVAITGPPGIGKTALLCRYLDMLETRGERVLVHFCDGGPEAWQDPDTVEASLITQLDPSDPIQPPPSPGQQPTFVQRVWASTRDAPLYVLVDGVDTEEDDNPVTRWTSGDFPRRLRLIYTAEKERSGEYGAARDRYTIDLGKRSTSNRDTCRQYLELHRPLIERQATMETTRLSVRQAPALEADIRPPEAWLLQRSEGVIGRLVAMVDWIRSHRDEKARLERMPPTLYDGFDDVWEIATSGDDSEEVNEVVGFVAAAKEEIVSTLVQRLLGLEADRVGSILSHLVDANLLNVWHSATTADEHLALAHESIRQPVLDHVGAERLRRLHSALANRSDPEYQLRYRLGHLVDAGRVEEARQEALDIALLTRICVALGVINLEAQLAYVAEAPQDVSYRSSAAS